MMVLFKVVNQQHCKCQERHVFQHFLDFFLMFLLHVCNMFALNVYLLFDLFTCFALFIYIFFVHMFIHKFYLLSICLFDVFHLCKTNYCRLMLCSERDLHFACTCEKITFALAYIFIGIFLHYASCEDWVIYIVEKCL
jgi:hypothetical protein